MLNGTDLLRSYLAGVLELSKAETATLYIPRAPKGLSRCLLVHKGDAPPLPELASPESALSFIERRADPTLGDENTKVETLQAGFLQSSLASGCLIPLPATAGGGSQTHLPSETSESKGQRRRRRKDGGSGSRAKPPGAWLGLRFSGAKGSTAPESWAKKAAGGNSSAMWNQLLHLGGALTTQLSQVDAILRDPISGLPDRAGLHSVLAEDFARARQQQHSLSLLLVNPDEFAAVNERFGREAGDRIIREITEGLQGVLRSTDPIFRYGGVIFAVLLDEVSLEAAQAVAEKILKVLSEPSYLDGAVRLIFSIGITVLEPGDAGVQHPLEMIRRADQALNAAKRLGGGTFASWEKSLGLEESGNFDRLSGIYTGNRAMDYRNMALQRDIIDVMAVHHDFQGLAAHVVEQLFSTFKPDRVGLLTKNREGELQLVQGLTRTTPSVGNPSLEQSLELTDDEKDEVLAVLEDHEPRTLTQDAPDEELPAGCLRSGYVVPLLASGECFGCLFIEGRKENLALEVSDLIFLRALCSQLAVALDRARLTELERQRSEVEKRNLLAELKTLRQAVQQAKMVYRSPQMERLVGLVRRVARTDATVLLTGQSGTGKELMARTLHELSPRKGKAFVIVDLSAIAVTLLESELFGHEKGAFTGAQQRREGRLAQADGGTVLLDEINVLSLEVQGKLLRFVQEKQLAMVGGTRPRKVDVRIIATSNKDLRSEVKAGNFREDLFHRLNVVNIELPRLKDRPEDILHLSRHFLETFAVQHHKAAQTLTSEAQSLLMQHSWPGNVRELQNRILRAVILCDDQVIGPEELGLPGDNMYGEQLLESAPERSDSVSPLIPSVFEPAETSIPPGSSPWAEVPNAAGGLQRSAGVSDQLGLRKALGKQIDSVANGPTGPVVPLGRWLSDDLVLAADRAVQGVARRGSALIGIPVSTYRRRRQKASELAAAGLSPRPPGWSDVRQLLGGYVTAPVSSKTNLLRSAERLLLKEILERYPGNERRGSALLGVTPLTYRRRVGALATRKAAYSAKDGAEFDSSLKAESNSSGH